jgi:hypothetical protein
MNVSPEESAGRVKVNRRRPPSTVGPTPCRETVQPETRGFGERDPGGRDRAASTEGKGSAAPRAAKRVRYLRHAFKGLLMRRFSGCKEVKSVT